MVEDSESSSSANPVNTVDNFNTITSDVKVSSSCSNATSNPMETPPASPPMLGRHGVQKMQNMQAAQPMQTSTPPAEKPNVPGSITPDLTNVPAILSPDSPDVKDVKTKRDSLSGSISGSVTGSVTGSVENIEDKIPSTPNYGRGERNAVNPSTPQAYSQMIPFSRSGSGASNGSGGVRPHSAGVGHGGPGVSSFQAYHGYPHTLNTELTPVISNSNIAYIDHPSTAKTGKPMPGFVVVSPAMMGSDDEDDEDEDELDYSPEGGADELSSGSGSSGGAKLGKTGGKVEKPRLQRLSSGGLKQRRLPPPRSRLPPAKRSSSEAMGMMSSIGSAGVAKSSVGGPMIGNAVGDVKLMGLGASSSGSPSTPNTNTSNSEGNDGLGSLLGEGLSMPSGLYSDESSVEKEPKKKEGPFRSKELTKEPIKEIDPALAPIELKPDRKYFSFSGTSQYTKTLSIPTRGLEPIPSPSRMGMGRPPASPVKEGHLRQHPANYHSATSHNQHILYLPQNNHQYRPPERAAHGVRAMADTKELNAIFKEARSTKKKSSSTSTTSAFIAAQGARPIQPMLVDLKPHTGQTDEPTHDTIEALAGMEATSKDKDNEGLALHQPIPIDDRQWSIPSIRLANHINQGVPGLSRQSSIHSVNSINTYNTFSDDECTEDYSLDASFRSYNTNGTHGTDGTDGDDDGSVSSRGSLDPAARRRMLLSGVVRRASSSVSNISGGDTGPPQVVPVTPQPPQPPQLPRRLPKEQDQVFRTEATGLPDETNREAIGDNSDIPTIAAIGPTTSFLERNLGRIAIDHKSYTFDDSEMGDDGILAPPAIFNVANDDIALDVPALTTGLTGLSGLIGLDTRHHDLSDHDPRDYCIGRRSGRNGRKSRRKDKRRSSKTAAFEWLQDLQSQSQRPSSDGVLIAEAASSKFFTGGTSLTKKAGDHKEVGLSSTRTKECSEEDVPDISKALGMPHPLCRSTTIDAQFVQRVQRVGAAEAFGFSQQRYAEERGDRENNMLKAINNPIVLTSSGSS